MINIDYITLKLFLEENIDFIIGARLQKIQQPTRRDFVLSLRNNGEGRKFYININPQNYHVAFMDEKNEKKRNLKIPQKPPMFCMLLRKYLEGCRISDALCIENERILELHFETMDEFSQKRSLCLAIELMGKHSNVILYDRETFVIIGCAHNVGPEKSRYRELQGGLKYIYPPKVNSYTPLEGGSKSPISGWGKIATHDYSSHALKNAKDLRNNPTKQELVLWQYLRKSQLGYKFRRQQPISNYIVDFLCSELKLIIELDGGQHNKSENIEYDKKRSEYLEKQGYKVIRIWNNEIDRNIEGVIVFLRNIINDITPPPTPLPQGAGENVVNNSLCPTPLPQKVASYPPLEGGSKSPISGWGITPLYEVLKTNYQQTISINKMIDDYFANIQEEINLKNEKHRLISIIQPKLKRVKNSIDKISTLLQKRDKTDEYKYFGELLKANLYQKADYQSKIEVLDYVSGKNITIELDQTKTLSENAQRYFKLYSKSKTTKEKSAQMLETLNIEREYLENDLYSIERAINLNELEDIEIEEKPKAKKEKPEITKLQINGFDVYIGKNNKQNDYIVSKLAKDEDIWFHTRLCAGSHVLLKVNGLEPDDETIFECCKLARVNSSAKQPSKVGVIYAKAKNLKKPPAAPLGYVIYKNEKEVLI